MLEQAEQLGFEFAEEAPTLPVAEVLPFRVIEGEAAHPYDNASR